MSMGEKMMGESAVEKPKRPQARTESSARLHQRAFEAGLNLENVALFDKQPDGSRPSSTSGKLKIEGALVDEIRDAREAAGLPREGGAADFFEAIDMHELSNKHYGRFIDSLHSAASKPPYDKSVDQLTAQEFRELYRAFPKREELEREENEALESYRLSLSEEWKLRQLDSTDAEILQIDIKHRRAERMEDDRAREQALDLAEKELRNLIASFGGGTPTEKLKNAGRRAEYETMAMVRSWARENDVDHLIEIEHALPRDDHKFGIDFRLRIGDRYYALDQKTLVSDEYQKEYQEQKTAGAAVFVLDSQHLKETYHAFLEGKVGAKDRTRILKSLADTLLPNDAEMLVTALSEKRKKSNERGKYVTEKFIVNFFSAKKLREIGVLSVDADVKEILATTKRVLEVARSIFKKMTDFDSPERIDQLKKALGKGL